MLIEQATEFVIWNWKLSGDVDLQQTTITHPEPYSVDSLLREDQLTQLKNIAYSFCKPDGMRIYLQLPMFDPTVVIVTLIVHMKLHKSANPTSEREETIVQGLTNCIHCIYTIYWTFNTIIKFSCMQKYRFKFMRSIGQCVS